MSYPNYTLDIISHHPQFNGKSLRKYHVQGIDTVGAWGDEPFEIVFKNNTYQKIQVKISVDGTDILTGQPADTNVSKDMWVVNGYAELRLKAWPEDQQGGAGFVFTSATNSVALHVHGDMSSRGIIAAAVFTEGHVEPQRVENHHHYHYDYTWPSFIYPYTVIGSSYTGPTWTYTPTYTSGTVSGNYSAAPNSLGSSLQLNNCLSHNTANIFSVNSCVDDAQTVSASNNTRSRQSLESLAAVGAGSYTEQKINYVAGLIKPIFTETVRVKYMWWDDLVAALRQANAPAPQPNGFPGDRNKHTHINLGSTPRMTTHGQFSRGVFRPAYEPVYSRV